MKYILFIIIYSVVILNAQVFEEHIVTTNALDAYFVDTGDIDNDGDLDILSASRVDHKISWYENDGDQIFTEHILTTDAIHAHGVLAVDMNNDGNMDILSASRHSDNIVWFENLGNHEFIEHVVVTNSFGEYIHFDDVDNDQDVDVLYASFYDHSVLWYENDGSQVFTEHIISDNAYDAWAVHSADIDNDGDIDVLSASNHDNKIAWYENNGNEEFNEYIISSNAMIAWDVYAIDLDSDGDIDVLSASAGDNKIAWYENDGNQFFTENIISINAMYAHSVFAIDMDMDNDIDVLSASVDDNKIAWYENNGNQFFTEHIITTDALTAFNVRAADVDGDGDNDVLSASGSDNKISWYENILLGCTDDESCNYNPNAEIDDGSCMYNEECENSVLNYIFSENIRITNTSNNQKFPEIAIDNNIIHLTWVSVIGNNKNIMYSKSENSGETFSNPVQINFIDNHVVAYGQSGPKIDVYNNKVYISYTDNRSGLTSIYLNISDNFGENWQEEVLISDTPYLNMYQDFKVDNQGNLHLVYYNYASNYELDDVRYRFSNTGDDEFHNSIPMGVVTDSMEPCDCCQPDLEIDINGDVYVAYRNNEQNIRDTYIAVKRYGDNNFSEYFQASNIQDFIGFCPSSGPSLDIKYGEIAVAYTSYNNQSIYTGISNLEDMDFSDYINVNSDSDSFQNYPYILLDNNLHAVWVDQNGFDIFYGMRDVETNSMLNIQKINDDDTNLTQEDPIIYKDDNHLYSFWSDNRNGNYEIYFSKAINTSIILGDINQDGIIDILDIVSIINFILGQENFSIAEEIASDLNSDGIINIQDVILIINIVLNN